MFVYRIMRYLNILEFNSYYSDIVFFILSILYYGICGYMDLFLGILVLGVWVCMLDRICFLDIFNESVCFNFSGYNVYFICYLN